MRRQATSPGTSARTTTGSRPKARISRSARAIVAGVVATAVHRAGTATLNLTSVTGAGEVFLKVEPLERGAGFEFIDRVNGLFSDIRPDRRSDAIILGALAQMEPPPASIGGPERAALLPVSAAAWAEAEAPMALDAIFRIVEQEDIGRLCIYHLVYSGRGAYLSGIDVPNEQKRVFMDKLIRQTDAWNKEGRNVEVMTRVPARETSPHQAWGQKDKSGRRPRFYIDGVVCATLCPTTRRFSRCASVAHILMARNAKWLSYITATQRRTVYSRSCDTQT